MTKVGPGLFDASPESLRVSRKDFRGTTLTPLTYSVQAELADAHGSDAKAQAQRHRTRMQSAPADGSGKVLRRQLSVSDLHPSSGTNPETGRFDSIDDFAPYQQRQLSVWMGREWVAALANASTLPLRNKTAALLDASGASKSLNIEELRELRRVKDKLAASGKGVELPVVLLGDVVDLLQTPRVRPGFAFPDGLVSNGRAPKNTPANAMVQLNIVHAGHRDYFRIWAAHLFLGHSIDYVPGNHDRAVGNPHVWSGEIEVDGRKIYGFTKLIALELRAMGATEAEVTDALSRLKLFPFILEGDKLFEHGDVNDQYNKARRPFKEFVEPTPLHDEMELAYGDHGVRDAFNDIERARPTLDAIERGFSFFTKALAVPRPLWRLVVSFLRGATRDGYDVSPSEDQRLREQDIAKVFRTLPQIVERANERLPHGRAPWTADALTSGFQGMDRVSARPFFSNFKRGTGFFRRLFTVIARGSSGEVDLRDGERARLDRIEAAHRLLGINDYIDGHTHVAKNDHYLTTTEQVVRHVNNHTWTSKSGNWNEDGNVWGEQSRGVVVLMSGVTATGIPWSELDLMRVVNEDGILVAGELLETYEPNEQAVRTRARAIYDANKPPTPQRALTPAALDVLPRAAKLIEHCHDSTRVR